jgi:hypothetical protein
MNYLMYFEFRPERYPMYCLQDFYISFFRTGKSYRFLKRFQPSKEAALIVFKMPEV